MDNCEQLRLMQDAAIVEELPEIRDSIEFCENMVDTLQEELNGLRGISFYLSLPTPEKEELFFFLFSFFFVTYDLNLRN